MYNRHPIIPECPLAGSGEARRRQRYAWLGVRDMADGLRSQGRREEVVRSETALLRLALTYCDYA